MSEILYKGIASALKIDADELIAKLKTDGGEWLSENEISKLLVSELTTAAAAATESAREIAHRKGQSEMSKKFSKLIKNSGFENPDNLSGDEYFEAFAAWKAEGDSGQPPSQTPLEQWTREDLEKLPIVKSLKLEAVQAGANKFDSLKKEYDAKQAEFEQFKEGIQKTTVLEKSKDRFRKALAKGNVILKPDGTNVDPEVRLDMAFEYFVNRERIGLNGNDVVILNNDGELKTDPAFGKPIDFDEIAVMYAEKALGVSTQNPNHAGSGIQQTNQNGMGKPGEHTPKMRFNNEKEYNDYMSTEIDGGNRLEASRSWQHQQSKAAGN